MSIAVTKAPPPPTDVGKCLYDSKAILWICQHWRPAGFLYYDYTGGSSIEWNDYSVLLSCMGTGERAEIRKMVSPFLKRAVPSWDKKRYFYVLLQAYIETSGWVQVYSGYPPGSGSQPCTSEHMGFKLQMEGGVIKMYATVANGTNETTLYLQDYEIRPELEAILYPGEKAEFYVNKVLKGTITTNIPTGENEAVELMHIRVDTNDYAEVTVYEARVYQEA